MIQKIKEILGLEKKIVPQQEVTQFEIGVVKDRLIIRFKKPVLEMELDRLETLSLIEALTSKIALTKKR